MFSLRIIVNGRANESFGFSARKWKDTESLPPLSLSLSLSLSLFLYMGRQAHRFRREDRRVNIHDSVRRAKCRVLSMLHRQWHPYAILYRG